MSRLRVVVAVCLLASVWVADASIDIRMWTSAAPCPWTRSYLGNHLAKAKAGSQLQVKYATGKVTTHWKPYVQTLTGTAGNFGAALAAAGGKTDAQVIAHINAQMLATNGIGAPGAAPAVFVAGPAAPKAPAAHLDVCVQYLSGLPAATAEGKVAPVKGGAAAAASSFSCSVFCAALAAHAQNGMAVPVIRSCSVAYGKNPAGAKRIAVSVSGNTAALQAGAYDQRVVPATITVGGAAVNVHMLRAKAAGAVLGTIPYNLDGAGGAATKAVWQSGGFLIYDRYMNPFYQYTRANAQATNTNVGICSEDKIIENLAANL